MAHRQGRITASNVHKVLHAKTPQAALKYAMMDETRSLDAVPAVKWGRDHEPVAKETFMAYMESNHKDFIFENTGLVLHEDFPFLAASPDGLFKCSCHPPGCLEIKCPFKYRDTEPTSEQALLDKDYCLDDKGHLKTGHAYYSQVQTQMAVTKTGLCAFLVWTPKGCTITHVSRDELFIGKLMDEVKEFVVNHLIPELLIRKLRNEAALPEHHTSLPVCKCKRPSFGKMIQCGSGKCETEWFHYECVELVRKPRGKWLCSDCS